MKTRRLKVLTLAMVVTWLSVALTLTPAYAAFVADGRLEGSELSDYTFFKITWQHGNASGSIGGGLLGIGTDPITGNHFLYYQLPVDYKDNTWGVKNLLGPTTNQVGGYGSAGGNQHSVEKIWDGDQLGGTNTGNRIVLRAPDGSVISEFNVDLLASLKAQKIPTNVELNNILQTGQLGNPFLVSKGLTELPFKNDGDLVDSATNAANFLKVATSTSWNIEYFGPSGTGDITQEEIDFAIMNLWANTKPGLLKNSPLVSTTVTSGTLASGGNLVNNFYTRVNPADPTSPIIDYDNVDPAHDAWWFPASFEIELPAALFPNGEWTSQSAIEDLANGNADTALVWIPRGGHISPNKRGKEFLTDPDFEIVPKPSIDIEKSTNGDDADTETGPTLTVGDSVTWEYVVTNTGNVELSNVTVTDDQTDVNPAYVSGDVNEDNMLQLEEVWIYQATGTAIEVQYANIGTVTGTAPDESVVDDTDPSHYRGVPADAPSIDIEKSTNTEDADTPQTGPTLTVGDTVTWEYVVTNTGNVELSNVTVTDDQTDVNPAYVSGDVNEDNMLQLEEVWIYQATGTAIEVQYANIGTVTGTAPDESVVDDFDPSHYSGKPADPPSIDIQKTVYWGHDSGASAASAGEFVIGENNDPVTYVFTVTNTGNTDLAAITIDDANLDINRLDLILLSGSEPLALDDSLVFYYETAISGDLINTAVASGNPVDENGEDIPDLTDPTDEDTAQVQEAASGIDIQKTVYAGHDSGGTAPGEELVIGADGSKVTYVFVVTNTGETHLNEIAIIDEDFNPNITRNDLTKIDAMSDDEPLAPGGKLVFYYQTTISSDLVNTASTSGNPVDDLGTDLPGFENPMASDTAEVKKAEPAIVIQKTVYEGHDSGDSAPGVESVTVLNGSAVTYVFTVTNTGNTYLDEVTIADSTLDPNITRADLTKIVTMSDPEPLAPDGELVFYYETAIDGDLVNTASTSGNPVDDQGEDIPELTDPTDDDKAEVQIMTGQVSVLKLTDGFVNPNKSWMFSVYDGPNASNGSSFLANVPLASAFTSGDEDGVLEFGTELDITATYTLCEIEVPSGWSYTWMIDTTGEGSADTIIIPYNPNVSDLEDLGNRCFDFGAGTDYGFSDDDVLVFEVNNISPPGGNARTPGYWKNWNTCSTGNQFQTAANNGGPTEGWYLLNDILNSPGVTWGDFTIETCEEGVSILDQRDLDNGRKRASDAAYTLAMHLLAYQLNQAAGAYSCPEAGSAAMEAENLLVRIGFDGTGRYLRPKSAEYQTALDLAATLDAYNNNELCN